MKIPKPNAIMITTMAITGSVTLGVSVALIVRYYKAKQVTEETNMQFKDKSLPRGYRNNNPLNIRISDDRWLGKVSPNTDGSFEQFSTRAYGYRAALKLLRTYITRYNCTSIEKMISRWAPANENNTAHYIDTVAKRTGIDKTRLISATDKDSLTRIAHAMSFVENGYVPNNLMDDINEGWDMI